MKKIWSAPEAIAEQFTANEYVAACGDENKVYKFTCNARRGDLYADRDNDGDMDFLGIYTPCSGTHESPVNDTYVPGFVDRNRNRREDPGEAVYVWIEYDRRGRVDDAHATGNLRMDSWETAKS